MANSFVRYPVDTTSTMSVMYHNTEVVNLHNNVLTLNSGGWKTNTTKSRINQYAGQWVSVFQKNFKWFVGFRYQIVPFVDGMQFDMRTNTIKLPNGE